MSNKLCAILRQFVNAFVFFAIIARFFTNIQKQLCKFSISLNIFLLFMAQNTGTKSTYVKTIHNRKARFEYEILDTWEAGIELKGTEVKSIRQGKASLDDSFAIIHRGEVYLENMQITPYELGTVDNHDPKRSRKLLMHREEIEKLRLKVSDKGLTLIPLKLYFNSKGKAKIELALAKGKKLHDKRESIKKRDVERDLRRGD
jgi:SsrA-binding protein